MSLAASDGRALEGKLRALGLSEAQAQTFGRRRDASAHKMGELSRALNTSAEVAKYPGLTIFAAGSHARGEASRFSDVDLFFLSTEDAASSLPHPHMQEIKIMADVIHITEGRLGFPPASNDGEYLKILHLSDNLQYLGSREDDYKNHFTARMLMILESIPVYNEAAYDSALEKFVESYFRDYEDHSADFRPTFVVNDIIRFWKTLCLNYEHKRNQKDEARKIKQKIRNFKLAYSRLTTCFSTVALLASYKNISRDDLLTILKLRPIDRLLQLSEKQPKVNEQLKLALEQYHWFLAKTEVSTETLESYFSDTNNRKEAFTHASKFGDAIYGVVNTAAVEAGTLRYLVV